MQREHANHFDGLRLLFALFVLITHAWSVTGRPEHDPIFLLTDGQTTLSYLGVRGFFAISGFLVLKSFLRTPDTKLFIRKRGLRIMPALIVNVAITGLLVGPLVSELPVYTYFTQPRTWAFLENPFRMLLGGSIHGLPGAFPLNPRPSTVNGALWTIPYELFCYGCILLLYAVRRNERLLSGTLLACTALLLPLRVLQDLEQLSIGHVLPFTAWDPRLVVELLPFFLIGAVVARFDLIPRSSRVLLALLFGLVLSYALHLSYLVDAVLWPFLIIGVGYLPGKAILERKRTGDISYGSYLWGYPVQQTVVMLCGTSLLWQFALAVPVTLTLGYISWRLVEAPALGLLRKKGSL